MKITFYGACQMVTGSCYLLEHNSTRILIDCGMIQGEQFADNKNYDPFPFDPKDIGYVLITHAHIDHCGRIPRLVRLGFTGSIISTHATLDFAELMLSDSANVLNADAQTNDYPPLYTIDDVTAAVKLFQGVEYHQSIAVGDLTVTFFDAGHILGSSFIRITDGQKTIVFSGDLGNSPVPLLHDLESLPETDYLVMESTYGNRVHEPGRERALLLRSAIYETVTMGGVLMIPAFALERTQEILYELRQLVENKDIPSVPIYIDSPLAIKATRLYRVYDHLFDKEATYLIKSGKDLFQFKGIKMTETRGQSKNVNTAQSPKVIIAGSGMMQGGRIRHHLKRYLSDFKNQLLIVGYQVEGSLGRQLLEGAKEVVIDEETIPVHAKVRAIGAYSAHADRPKVLAWVTPQAKHIQQVWLTHGEVEQATSLAGRLQSDLKLQASVPEYGQVVEL